ncbi:MAG TPA: hypothetical protein VMV25_13250 [Steroidobacteraceae bacterium]|nr:hypothetical protein [Steroidobacteraceae bacterium]
MRPVLRRLLPAVPLIALLNTAKVHAGPPFYTDDPEPVDYRHNEFYVFSTLDRSYGSDAIQGPAIEYNRGIARNTQFHVVLPFSYFSPAGAAGAFGFGDVEVGIKYRFIEESCDRPQIGFFPMAEIATGSAARGLGNGHTWYRLPLWIQKSWGPWTSYGGAGIDINHAPGMRDSTFGGLLIQRDLSPRLTLGGELFRQNAQVMGARGYTLLNLGGYYNFTRDFSLLFSGGRSATGERHTVAYLGLYWTWGSPG